MNKFELFLFSSRELLTFEGIKYVKLSDALKYLGHDTLKSLNTDIFYINGDVYITTENAEQLVKTIYNKNNPKVVQYHKQMGFTNMEYTVTAKALTPVMNTANKVNAIFKNASDSIDSTFQHFF